MLQDETITANSNVAQLIVLDPTTRAPMHEVIVNRSHGVVEVYSFLNQARRYYRKLDFTTDYRKCLATFYPNANETPIALPSWLKCAIESSPCFNLLA